MYSQGLEASVCSPSTGPELLGVPGQSAPQPCIWGSLSYLPKCSNYWFPQSPSMGTVTFSLHTDPGTCVLLFHFIDVETEAQRREVRHPGAPS